MLDLDGFRRLPLFQPLSEAELERIAELAGERAVNAGEVIVEEWDATHEFYVLLEGTAVVRTAGRHLDDIGPGDFFGEIAALGRSQPWRRPVTALPPIGLTLSAGWSVLGHGCCDSGSARSRHSPREPP